MTVKISYHQYRAYLSVPSQRLRRSWKQFKLGNATACLAAAFVLFSRGVIAAPVEIVVASPTSGAVGAASVSLFDAMAKVEALSAAEWPREGVIVRLQAGTYRLDKPLRLNARLSGRVGAPLIFKGPTTALAVLNAARPVSGFGPVESPEILSRLPAAARAQVRQASLSTQGIADPGRLTRQGQGRNAEVAPLELFYRGKPMPLAQWPNQGYVLIEAVGPGNDGVKLAQGQFNAWAGEADLWMTGYWGQDWADEWIAVASVDAGSRTIKLNGGPPLYPAKPGQRVKVVNALAELDSPGEWYLDRSSGILYFWPPEALADGDVEVSVLPNVVLAEGASHVHFDGIAFEGVRGDAIVVKGGRDVRIQRARIRNAGNRAVTMNGVAHAVVDSDIQDTGQGGIVLSGGDRQTLEPANSLAQGNRIQRFNRWVKTYRAAVALNGVGNTARGNLIFDGPHTGLLFYGNDHLIEYNELHSLAKETGDVGAIYTGRDWTARGTVIRHNYLHDIRGPGRWGSRGVYLDDQTSGIVLQGNLFARVDHAIFLGGGRDNMVDNNLFVDSSPAIHLDARGRTWQKAQTDDPDGLLRKRLREVPYQKSPYADRYPGLAKLLNDSPGSPRGNVARRNGVIGKKALDLQDGTDKELEVDRMFSEADFVFLNTGPVERRQRPSEFVLNPVSPALRAGFAELPLQAMGCWGHRWAGGADPLKLIACPWRQK